MDEAVAQIAQRQDKRHNHYNEENVTRCPKCSMFLSEDAFDVSGSNLRWYCPRCKACRKYLRDKKAPA